MSGTSPSISSETVKSTTSNANKSIFTNYVTSPLSVEKLNGSNDDTWAGDIKLWVEGDQEYEDHLTKWIDKVPTSEKSLWKKIDAQLCSVIIKSTLHPDIKPIFRPHVTCESVWSQAKKLYTNDIQRLYGGCHRMMNMIHSNTIDGSINTYIGNVHTALNEFNELLTPAASDPTEQVKERKQDSTFFMLLDFYGIPPEYFSIRDQILVSVDVPNMDMATFILLRVPAKYATEPSANPAPGDTASLGSLSNNQNHFRGGHPSLVPSVEVAW